MGVLIWAWGLGRRADRDLTASMVKRYCGIKDDARSSRGTGGCWTDGQRGCSPALVLYVFFPHPGEV